MTSHPRTHRPALLLVLLAASSVSACGSSSGDHAGATLSASQYRAKANAVCARAAHELAALGRPRSFGALQPYLRRSLSALRPAAAQLTALRPPDALLPRAGHAAGIISGEVFLLRRTSSHIRRGADPREAARPLRAQLAYMTRRAEADWRHIHARTCARRMTAAMRRPVAVLVAAPLPPAKSNFLSAANAICARNLAVERAWLSKFRRTASVAARLQALRALMESADATMAQLRSLQPPAHDRARVGRIFARTEKALRVLHRAVDGILSRDPALIAQGESDLLDQLSQINASNRAYAAYGMTECAK